MLLELLAQIRSYPIHTPIFLPMGGGHGGGNVGPVGGCIMIGIIILLILWIVGMLKYDDPFPLRCFYRNFQRWRGKDVKNICDHCDNAFMESQLSEYRLNLYYCEKCWNTYHYPDFNGSFVAGTRKIR